MSGSLRRRDRSWLGIGVLVVLALVAILQVVIAIRQGFDWGYSPFLRPGYSDFGPYYLYARMGIDHGWGTLYDLAIERQELQMLGGPTVILPYPMIYPPPLAWLVTPLAFLPLPVAFTVWVGVLVGMFLAIWKLLVRGRALLRWTHLAMAFTLFPVVFGLLLAQVLIPVLAAVAIAWRLLSRRHEVLAGLVLLLILVKPQVAFLVPVALLASGRWRAFVTWSIGAAVITGLAVLSIGPDGVRLYALRLSEAASASPEFLVPTHLTLQGLLGPGVLGIAARVLVAGMALAIAYRHRGLPDIPVAAGLVGSLLVTPYIHVQDLTALLVAAWIYLRVPLHVWQRWILFCGWALLALTFGNDNAFVHTVQTLVVALEVVWLAAMYVRRGQALPLWWSRRDDGRIAA